MKNFDHALRRIRIGAIVAGILTAPGLMEGAPDHLETERMFRFPDGRDAQLIVHADYWLGGPVLSGQNPDAVEAGVAGVEGMRVWITSQLFVQVDKEQSIEPIVSGFELTFLEETGDGFYVFEASDAFACAEISSLIGQDDRVYSVGPIMKWPVVRTDAYSSYPTDPYFREQTHLENRDSVGRRKGIDLNVRAAWPISRGQGISIAIVDDGIETTHPDLSGPATGQPHFDYVSNRSYSSSEPPTFGFHGTNVAGLAGAAGENDIGVSGVAPEANLTSLLIFGRSEFDFASDLNLSRLFRHQPTRVQVQNHSWASGTMILNGPSRIVSQAITNAVTIDRNGLGIIMVRSAGNFRTAGVNHPGNGNVNDDKYPSDPHVITVAASDKEGKATSYSSPGAAILVAAPSGDSENSSPNLMTTDLVGTAGANSSSSVTGRPDYAFGSNGFNGTSASSPEIAGLAALILSKRPDLHYRDVQQILAMSAKQYFPDPHTQMNGGGFEVNDNVGFGIPDAGLALRLATTWTSRPPLEEKKYDKSVILEIDQGEFGLSIPEAEGSANLKTWISGKPSLGPVNDDLILSGPLTYVGLATASISQDLNGRGALIQRGQIFFKEKINRAAEAGAKFAIVFNNQDNSTLIMAETDYTSIPAIFIGKDDGEALRSVIADNPDLVVNLTLKSKSASFTVPDEMLVEYVGLRVTSNISRRIGLRITLFSPTGTKSELHHNNSDTISGLSDWTFHSAHHMFEPSKGVWRVQVSNVESADSSGIVDSLTLMIRGVTITDQDGDGLSDEWERTHFKSLDKSAREDSDLDGFRNGFEQMAGTSPMENDRPFNADLGFWKNGYLRLSWPGEFAAQYDIFRSSNNPNQFGRLQSEDGVFPITDTVVPIDGLDSLFFHVIRKSNQ